VSALPTGWVTAGLAEICAINPRVDKTAIDPASAVSFVPMPAVEAETGKIDISETRNFKSVRKGYTPFRTGDVLFAKITPCMENGKMAIVPELASPYGFGSTEFHVLRPCNGVDPRFIYHCVSNRAFRVHAEHNMTGAVGQKRVPASILEEHEVDLPPIDEQRRIVEKIEALFAEIDKGVESLKAAKSALALYRKSLLKSAFEGHLTAAWRERNPDKLESPEALLARIRNEREKHHQAALDEWKRTVAEWKKDGKQGRKPVNPKRPSDAKELSASTPLPSNWASVTLESLGRIQTGATPPTRNQENFGGDVPFFKPTDLDSGDSLRQAREFLSEAGAEASRQFSAGAVLVTCIGATIGKTGLATVDGACNQQINFLEPNVAIESKFIYFQLISPHFQDQIKEHASSTTLPILNKGKFCLLAASICSPVEQAEIVRILDARLEAAKLLEAEIEAALARADALRQSILKKAFAGKLVPQDPSDEPADALLVRIRASRDGHSTAKPRKPTRRSARPPTPP